jgi:thiamine-monophosphate kinase
LLNSSEKPVGAIDISDGLSSELWHLARQSGCALRVDAERLPLHPALSARAPSVSLGHALHGGEEYQLLFTGDFSPVELESLRAVAPISEIGIAEAGEGVFVREGRETRPLTARGYQHGGEK